MLDVRPVTPFIGAEVAGIDLGEPCDRATLAALEAAWTKHKVLFFREQHLTTEQHVAFCRQFGDLEVHPFVPSKPGYPEVMVVISNEHRRGNIRQDQRLNLNYEAVGHFDSCVAPLKRREARDACDVIPSPGLSGPHRPVALAGALQAISHTWFADPLPGRLFLCSRVDCISCRR